MTIFDEIRMCLRNLWRRKMRTLLTTFGVVIGTCAIVVMVSLGVGMDAAQQAMLEGQGNLRLIQVYSGWDYEYYQEMQEKGIELGESPPLDYAAVQRMKQLDHVEAATPMDNIWNDEFVLQSGDRYRYQGQIVGIDMASMPGLGYQLAEGRWPSESEYKNAVIVGSKAAYQFIDTKRRRDNMVSAYPDENGIVHDPYVNWNRDRLFCAIGDPEANNAEVEFGNGWMSQGPNSAIPTKYGKEPLKVCGVLSTDEAAIDRSFDSEYTIYMDVSRVQELRKEYYKRNKIRNSSDGGYNNVYVMVDDVANVTEVQNAITRTREFGFSAYSLTSQRESMQQFTQTIQLVLGGLAGISLLVAALGIANTMVMSIYERTREIGIMKVLGCMVGNIRTVFLMEAGCIGLLGGVLGVGISYGISFALNAFLGAGGGDGGGLLGDLYMSWASDGPIRISIIPPWLVAGALTFAIFVGLVSGFSPANRAVKISALEAIKHE